MSNDLAGDQRSVSPGFDPNPEGLPTSHLQDDWADILTRIRTTYAADLERASEYALAWSNALLRAQVIDLATYQALNDARVQSRDEAEARFTGKGGGQ
ncbi:hypothetical protein B0E42_20425 [Pseudomonas sp. A25(2017)]|uniref:hypothetical protein n=1 Tax=Pseudomonas sp. A25(2017) TaxID=1945865 RepID=UPI0009842D34|nr:hypothetical protein [Pseudomonas sp. A25(2017)]OOG83204.1 hypothetical protein B0E42_20425 [Pseudomonas sp. A25(2017)]